MNVVLNIKEIQLRGVLKELGKIGKGVNISVNINEDEFKEDRLKEEVFEKDEFKEESGSSIREELEEMREKVLGNIDA